MVPEAVEADRSEEEAVVAARVAVEVPSAEEAVAADPSVEEVAEVDRLAVVGSRECVYLFYAPCWFDYRCLVFLTNRSSMCRGQTDHRCEEQTDHRCEEDKQIIGVKRTNRSSLRRRQQHLRGVASLALRVLLLHGLMERQNDRLVLLLVIEIEVAAGVLLNILANQLLQIAVHIRNVDNPVVLTTADTQTESLLRKVDELVPVFAGPQLRLISNHEQAESRTREAHVHATNVRNKANAVGGSCSHG